MPTTTTIAALAALSLAAPLALVGCGGMPDALSPFPSSGASSATRKGPQESAPTVRPVDAPGGLDAGRHDEIGEADGELPDGVTAYDDRYPAVAKLDGALLDALRDAADDARREGHELQVNSGWRSRAYQQELFDRAVAQYGSAAEASKWVAEPGTSVHEAGDAVDIGPDDTASWLHEHGSSYGLCRIYVNEPWHFELRPDAVDDGCPAMFLDPTDDPRMQR